MQIHLVMKRRADKISGEPIAAFKNEADAFNCADKHKVGEDKTWVEEVNYYE